MPTSIRVLSLVALFMCGPIASADWPTYRGNVGRTAVTHEVVPVPLKRVWEHVPNHPPIPAWPAPARGSYWQQLDHIQARITDDHAFHPVIAGDSVFYASTADDQVHCLDASTGTERWIAFTDGPIRYAPVVSDDRVYVGGDDGLIRCLEAKSGKEIWAVRVGPSDDRIPGNGRLISTWPIRTGLLVMDNIIYATAGLYPSQGVYAVALSAQDGSIHWRRRLNVSAQGYLLASDKHLIVPTGRATPITLDRTTGRVLKAFGSVGGTFAVVTEGKLITGPGNDGTLSTASIEGQQRVLNFRGRDFAAGPQMSYFVDTKHLSAIDRKSFREGETEPTWKVPTDASCLAVAGDVIFLGGTKRVEARRASDGKLVWNAEVNGTVAGLAIVPGRLIATTIEGRLICFRTESVTAPAPVESPVSKPDRDTAQRAANLLERLPSKRGYGLIVGLKDGHLARTLAEQSDLNVVAVSRDAETVRTIRATIGTLYGHRVAVHHLDSDQLPFVDYTFDLIASESGDSSWDQRELMRLVRPYGGVLSLNLGEEPIERGPLDGAGEWKHQFGNLANTANSGDRLIHRDLALQWFGGPGPSRMVDRHLRAPAPLFVNGRVFVPGENKLIAVNAYNGTELWDVDLPKSQRYSMPYDAGYMSAEGDTVAVAVRDQAWILDAKTGERQRSVSVPDTAGGDRHWGYLALADGALYGSEQKSTASRTEPSRDLVDRDYNNLQPVVTGLGFFRTEAESGKHNWRYQGGVILNTTITIADEIVYFVESRSRKVRDHATGRMTLDVFMDDVHLVALSTKTGQVVWQQPLDADLMKCRNVLFLQHAEGLLIGCGSHVDGRDSRYRIVAMNATTGKPIWSATHLEGKPNAFTHGEQVHHPLVLNGRLIAEPAIYDLKTGERFSPNHDASEWRMIRPGHSCGTISGAGDCMFFRAGNPTVMDLADTDGGRGKTYHLSPTRPGCWINIIPAGGLVIIPEGSASCVCHFSLQTSMAFRPVAKPVELLAEIE